MQRPTAMPNSTHRGVDLSHHNASPDFGTLKAGGVEFVALKATEGVAYTDPTFADRQARARLVGFSRLLFYHFLRPDNDPGAQASLFASRVGTLRAGELVVIDVEPSLMAGHDRWAGLSPVQSVRVVLAFVEALKVALGIDERRVVLYGSLGWLRGQFGSQLPRLAGLGLWAARYRDLEQGLGDTSPWSKALIWQHSERGTASGAGAPGTVDLDVWMDPGAWAR